LATFGHFLQSSLRARTKAEITFRDLYPPMPPTAGDAALLSKLDEVNRALGAPNMEAADPMIRGAGDASFVAPFVAVLDGLGAPGTGMHAPGESVDLARFPLQTKRVALLIYARAFPLESAIGLEPISGRSRG
jgi:glutamate carboxypeptidase